MGHKPKDTGYWIVTVSTHRWHYKRLCFHPQLNFDALFEHKVWGLSSRWSSVKCMKPGDKILVYLGGGYSAFAGCAVVQERWRRFKGRELDEFVDVRLAQPMRSGIRLANRLRVRFACQVPVALIAKKLKLCGNQKYFREYMQKSFRSISAEDFKECLKAAVELNPTLKGKFGSGAKLHRSIDRYSKSVAAKSARPSVLKIT